MIRMTNTAKAVNKGLMLSSLCGIAFVAAPLMANDATIEENVERIEVTGSRIAREGTITPSPVTVITAEQLTQTGAINIGEALNELPALASTFSLSSSTQYIGTAGLNLLDLRNMGTSRTLVLVDGKRHVSSSAGDSSVDINTIPTAWVESVEIITGGASAVYGADAVTGVVNFRLKRDITGFNANVVAGYAEDSGYNNQRFMLSYGKDYADGKGNAAISVEHSRQSNLTMMERDSTSTSWTTVPGSLAGQNVDSAYVVGGHYAINNAGVIYGPWNGLDSSYTFNSDGSLREINTGDNQYTTKCWGGDCEYINLNQFEDLQPEFDRTTVNFKTNYELDFDAVLSVEAKWSQTNALQRSQPAFFFGSGNSIIQYDNAFIQDDLKAVLDAAGFQDGDAFYYNKFLNDFGQRMEDDTRTTQRYVASLTGTLADAWDYEVYGVYGQTELERLQLNNLIYSHYINAIDAVEVNGEIVCRDEEARANGCVPANIFGDGTVDQAAIDYVMTDSPASARIEQIVLGGSISNSELFELPAGFVGMASGIEYREEKMKTEEDPLAATGDTFFNAFPNDKAEFDVSEAFVEFTVPLLYDLFAVNSLTLDAAVRFADYSTVGNATSWKLGLDWEVYDDLRIRSTYSTAIRAPNLSEFYGAESENFFQVNDSCKVDNMKNLTPEQMAIRQANCAALGVPADFNSDYDSAYLNGVNVGNQELEPEESESYTVGFVYQPNYFDGFSATVDYWNIEITDAISGISAQTMVDRCVDDPTGINNTYCGLLERDPTSGEITKITNKVINVAKLEAEGVDFEFAYDTLLGNGELRTSLIATYLIKNDNYEFQDNLDNYYEYAGVAGNPEWSGIFTTNYNWDRWNAFWKVRYVDRVDLYTPQDKELYAIDISNIMEWGSYITHDVVASYQFDNNLVVGFGVDNVFDRDLPITATGTGAASATYDNIGRFYYVNFDYGF